MDHGKRVAMAEVEVMLATQWFADDRADLGDFE
jgi:hypothetical protein